MCKYCFTHYVIPIFLFDPIGRDGVFAPPTGDVHSREAVSSRRALRQAGGGGGDRAGFCAAGALLYIMFRVLFFLSPTPVTVFSTVLSAFSRTYFPSPFKRLYCYCGVITLSKQTASSTGQQRDIGLNPSLWYNLIGVCLCLLVFCL